MTEPVASVPGQQCAIPSADPYDLLVFNQNIDQGSLRDMPQTLESAAPGMEKGASCSANVNVILAGAIDAEIRLHMRCLGMGVIQQRLKASIRIVEKSRVHVFISFIAERRLRSPIDLPAVAACKKSTANLAHMGHTPPKLGILRVDSGPWDLLPHKGRGSQQEGISLRRQNSKISAAVKFHSRDRCHGKVEVVIEPLRRAWRERSVATKSRERLQDFKIVGNGSNAKKLGMDCFCPCESE